MTRLAAVSAMVIALAGVGLALATSAAAGVPAHPAPGILALVGLALITIGGVIMAAMRSRRNES